MKKRLVFIIVVTALLLSSCKSKKIITDGEKATSTGHLITLIQQAQPSFSTMNNNIKVNVDMNGETYSTSAGIKIITDSVVVFAIYPFLGMEMFSMELYPDKWILYNKMNLKYVTDDYQFFSYRYGINVNFENIQSIFSARLFELGANDIDYKRYKFTPLEGNRNEIIFENQQVKQTTRTNNINTIEYVSLQSKTNNYLMTVQYNHYVINKGINYPQNIIMNTVINDAENVNLNINVQKVNFNNDVKLSLSRKDRYTRTTIDQIFTK